MQLCVLVLGLVLVRSVAALPFAVMPLGDLPTSYPEGGSVAAFYTVTNKTTTARANNYLKYLPPNVTQKTTGPFSDVCGSTFSLAAKGTAGDSCTLVLEINGEVAGASSDPRQNLFVCFPGGKTCAGTRHPLKVSAQKQFAILNGSYSSASTTHPLLGQSTDGGKTWTYNESLPTGYVNSGEGQGTYCGADFCLSVGSYANAGGVQLPFVARSEGSDKTLSYPATVLSQLPADYANQGTLQAVHCAGQTCAAVGRYETAAALRRPLIAFSQDAGQTWSYPATATSALPVNFASAGVLTTVSCTSAYCVAGGSYVDNGAVRKPLLGRGGSTWSYISSLPADFASAGTLESMTCLSSLCFAVGSYQNAGGKQAPLLMRSPDSFTWFFPASVLTLPGDYLNQATFYSVACHNTLCLAVGSYNTASADKFLVAKSNDSGTSWGYVTTLAPADLGTSALAEKAYCVSDACFIAGHYTDTGNGNLARPVVVATRDGGSTFSFADGIATLPANFAGQTTLSQLACRANSCVAGGGYFNGVTIVPLIAASHDAGRSWSYPASATAALPTNFSANAQFAGAGFQSGQLQKRH